MRSDYDGPEKCQGRSRQRQAPCDRPPTPFGRYCLFHGGWNPAERERARKASIEYERWSTDPYYIKSERLKLYRRSVARFEMKQAKKRGPEYVEALLRERAAEKANMAAWYAENKRVREEKKRQATEEWRRVHRPTAPAFDPYNPPSPGRAIPYDSNPFAWDD